MAKLLFSGCSITQGIGLDSENNNKDHYINVFTKQAFDNNAVVKNIGVAGNSNFRIFLDTSIELTKEYYDYAFVSWTSYPRHVFWAGLELYECRRSLTPGLLEPSEHHGNDQSFSTAFFKDLRDKFVLVHHDHYEILDIIKYISLLSHIGTSIGTKIYFINNLCSWDYNYFNQLHGSIKPNNLSDYTNKLLNSSNRDDSQIEKLYNIMHQQYNEAGGIRSAQWLNLYNNIRSMTKDVGTDNLHPGPKTHLHYGNFLTTQFKN